MFAVQILWFWLLNFFLYKKYKHDRVTQNINHTFLEFNEASRLPIMSRHISSDNLLRHSQCVELGQYWHNVNTDTILIATNGNI